jgi:hypothetical protein
VRRFLLSVLAVTAVLAAALILVLSALLLS